MSPAATAIFALAFIIVLTRIADVLNKANALKDEELTLRFPDRKKPVKR